MDTKLKIHQIIKILDELFPNPKIALNYSNVWELFVAVVLSAQSTDKKVNEITQILFTKYKTLKDYKNARSSEFENDIRQIGLYRNKAKNIISSAKIIDKEYNGKVPDSIRELIKLPGVGRKTANVILNVGFGKTEGIAVDTHVARLSRLFGLTNQKDPDKIEQDLLKIVPKTDWKRFNLQMVLYGRQYCPAHCKHIDCPLRDLAIQME